MHWSSVENECFEWVVVRDWVSSRKCGGCVSASLFKLVVISRVHDLDKFCPFLILKG